MSVVGTVTGLPQAPAETELENMRSLYRQVFKQFIREWLEEGPGTLKAMSVVEVEIRSRFYEKLDGQTKNWFHAEFEDLLQKSF